MTITSTMQAVPPGDAVFAVPQSIPKTFNPKVKDLHRQISAVREELLKQYLKPGQSIYDKDFSLEFAKIICKEAKDCFSGKNLENSSKDKVFYNPEKSKGSLPASMPKFHRFYSPDFKQVKVFVKVIKTPIEGGVVKNFFPCIYIIFSSLGDFRVHPAAQLKGCSDAINIFEIKVLNIFREAILQIVQMYSSTSYCGKNNQRKRVIYTELCKTDLRQAVEKKEPFNKIKVLKDVLLGLQALHKKGIVHNDIKPANILLVHRGACITDFGHAAVRELVKGTHWYNAPEHLVVNNNTFLPEIPFPFSQQDISFNADIWAAGCTFFETYLGSSPLYPLWFFAYDAIIRLKSLRERLKQKASLEEQIGERKDDLTEQRNTSIESALKPMPVKDAEDIVNLCQRFNEEFGKKEGPLYIDGSNYKERRDLFYTHKNDEAGRTAL